MGSVFSQTESFSFTTPASCHSSHGPGEEGLTRPSQRRLVWVKLRRGHHSRGAHFEPELSNLCVTSLPRRIICFRLHYFYPVRQHIVVFSPSYSLYTAQRLEAPQKTSCNYLLVKLLVHKGVQFTVLHTFLKGVRHVTGMVRITWG